jgi:phage terminase large subunit GpA-like protein
LPRGYTAKPGRFEPFPFQIEPLDLVIDERYNGMTLCWASQALGKTEVINCVLGWALEAGPGGGMMMVQPTIQMAAGWSKLKLAPLLEDLEKPVEDGERTYSTKGTNRTDSTVSLKIWPEGYLVTGGANSAAALSMFSVRYLFFDEVDRYPRSVATRGNDEGDPLTVAERRSETFSDSFSIHTSTPTTKGMSRIEAELNETDIRKWHIKCKKCKRLFVIMWNDIKWEKNRPETAWLECPHCHAKFGDKERVAMVRKGKWIATNPKVKNKPGFWANAFISLLPHKRRYKSRMHQWSSEYLEAKSKGTDSLRAFINQVLTESFEEPASPEILFNRREHFFEGDDPVLPEGVLVLTLGVDKQLDRIEAELVGWGVGEESWSLEYKIIPGDFENKAFRDRIGEWLNEKYVTANGKLLQVASACFDSGDRPESVYKFVREQMPKPVWAIKGYGGNDIPWVNRSSSVPRLVTLNVDAGKGTVYARLGITEPGPGCCHFPFDRDAEWYKQLTSERIVSYVRQGQVYKRFEISGGCRNEALDARTYSYAALLLLGRLNWKRLAAQMGVGGLDEPAPEAPEKVVPVENEIAEAHRGFVTQPPKPSPTFKTTNRPVGRRRFRPSPWGIGGIRDV